MPEEFKIYKSILRLKFFNVEHKYQLGKTKPSGIPQSKGIKKVIKYFQKSKETSNGFTVHCWQRLSRSTEIAALLLHQIYHNEEEAIDELLKIRPKAVPNTRIIKIYCTVMVFT